MILRLSLGSVCRRGWGDTGGGWGTHTSALLGGGREGVHRPYKLELNMLTLEQVYHVTWGFIMSFTIHNHWLNKNKCSNKKYKYESLNLENSELFTVKFFKSYDEIIVNNNWLSSLLGVSATSSFCVWFGDTVNKDDIQICGDLTGGGEVELYAPKTIKWMYSRSEYNYIWWKPG